MTPTITSLAVALDELLAGARNSGVEMLVLQDKKTTRHHWIWINPNHPKYNLGKYDSKEARWVLVATLP